MSKQIKSKLDQFAEPLAAQEAEGKTLLQIIGWLRDEGCAVSLSTLSRFLESQRQAKLQAQLLRQIATGAKQVKEVEKSFGENPPPETETLIKLLRVFILQLSTQANQQPELFELVNPLLKTVADFSKLEIARQQAAMDERKLQLLEKKAAAYDRAQAALESAKSSKGGVTAETMQKIEAELRLL